MCWLADSVIVLGLTGSIGMGKSTVSTMLRRLGVPVHDADGAVHRLLQPGGKAFSGVAQSFPMAVVAGRIDRRVLGRIVFHDKEAMARLEAILHPLVASRSSAFIRIAGRRGVRVVALDIPLLFEKRLDRTVDFTLTVSAPAAIQRSRVLARPGMTPETYEAIVARQIPDREKRRRSDFVIETGVHCGRTLHQLQVMLRRLKFMETGKLKLHARNRPRYRNDRP